MTLTSIASLATTDVSHDTTIMEETTTVHNSSSHTANSTITLNIIKTISKVDKCKLDEKMILFVDVTNSMACFQRGPCMVCPHRVGYLKVGLLYSMLFSL